MTRPLMLALSLLLCPTNGYVGGSPRPMLQLAHRSYLVAVATIPEGSPNKDPAHAATTVGMLVAAGWMATVQRSATPMALTVLSAIALGMCTLLASAPGITTNPDDEGDITCYKVNGIERDGKPFFLCTANPQEAAWFYGVSISDFEPADGIDPTSDSCELEWSYTGEEEWVCDRDSDTT